MVKVYPSADLSKGRNYQIKTSIHEGAVAVSGAKMFLNKDFKNIQDIMIDEFRAINSWVLDSGGIIGHIKGFIEASEQSSMISTTGGEVGCRSFQSIGESYEGVQLSIALIVFNISELFLEEKLISIFDRLQNV